MMKGVAYNQQPKRDERKSKLGKKRTRSPSDGVRHQADVRCKPGARLGDTTIGGVMDALLRGPLGLS
jgi:hypothetical protein